MARKNNIAKNKLAWEENSIISKLRPNFPHHLLNSNQFMNIFPNGFSRITINDFYKTLFNIGVIGTIHD